MGYNKNIMKKCAVISALFLALFVFLSHTVSQVRAQDEENIVKPALHVDAAYIKKPTPGAQAAAGLMIIHNNTDEDNALIAVKSSAAGVVELHGMSMENDVMRMRRTEKVIIPAHSSAALSMDTGDHLMFMNMTHDYALNETISATLTFENGAMLEIEMPVLQGRANTNANDDHGHHKGHDMPMTTKPQIKNGAEEDSAVDVEALHDHEHHGAVHGEDDDHDSDHSGH